MEHNHTDLSDISEQWNLPFHKEDWEKTPHTVRFYIIALEHKIAEQQKTIEALIKRVDELESRLSLDSSKPNQPPSSDSPFKGKRQKTRSGKPGGRKGHKGHRQVMLEPGKTEYLKPEACVCGNKDFPETSPYCAHQHIELPEIEMEVTHFILYRGPCPCCGKMGKASLLGEYLTGYDPRFSATIAQMAGGQGDSRTTIQEFCASVLGIPISLGAIQKVIDRVSSAIEPHYDEIGKVARQSEVNHIDETSFSNKEVLQWLWVMANSTVACFMIHANRSKKAFEALIRDWQGILVSDGYGVYCKWVGQRQSCHTHLIRKARELSQRKDLEIAGFGNWALTELQRLCHMAHGPPTIGEWGALYARLIPIITLYRDRKDAAGKFALRLHREIDSHWLFLEAAGVAPTNNNAERMLRFAMLWRKRSQGTASKKGNRCVERILSLRQTCRLHSRNLFPTLVEAIKAYFSCHDPDLAWIARG